jgi:thiol-disulfide isomerase/thioredoxin
MMHASLKLLCFIVLFVSLNGCKPIYDSELYQQWLDRGTLLVEGDYSPADHWAGQWRLVNIWAQWCKPCWQEMPELNQFHALQGPNDIKVLGYNFDQLQQEELKQLKTEMNIQFPVLVSWPESWQLPDVKGLPATLIIAPNNQVVKVLWGPQTLSSFQKEIDAARNSVGEADHQYE